LISFGLGVKKDITELKKAGVACLDIARVNPPAGKLIWLMTPRAVRKISKGK